MPASPSAVRAATLALEQLFQQHSVSELRQLEQKARVDTEKKKEELRLRVGDRYRDVIEAGETILKMTAAARTLQESLHHLESSYSRQQLEAQVEQRRSERKQTFMGDKKRNLLPLAALMKILVDTPEQIYHSLEHDRYLSAALLFLISGDIQRRLDTTEVHKQQLKKMMRSFPIIKHQWEATGPLKQQIVAKCRNFLVKQERSDQTTSEALVALMLLDNNDEREIFVEFLDRRRASIASLLTDYQKHAFTPSETFRTIVGIVKATIYQVQSIFTRSDVTEEPSSISVASYVRTLKEGVSLDTFGQRDHQWLYDTSKTNIHLLFRYLPEPLKHYTPYIKTAVEEKMSRRHLRDSLQEWVRQVQQTITEKGPLLLESAQSGRSLMELQIALRSIVQMTTNEEEHREKWRAVCLSLLERDVSIWHDFLQGIFVARAKSLMDTAFSKLQEDVLVFIRDRAASISATESEEGSNFGDELWARLQSNNEHGNAKMFLTEEVYRTAEFMSLRLDAIRSDYDGWLLLLGDTSHRRAAKMLAGGLVGWRRKSSIAAAEDDSFSLFDDESLSQLRAYFMKSCWNSMWGIHGQMEGLVGSAAAVAASTSAVTHDRLIFMGRVCRSLVYHCKAVRELLYVSDPLRTAGDKKPISTEEAEWTKFESACMNVFASAHDPWIHALSERWYRSVSEHLRAGAYWKRVSRSARLYEDMKGKATGGNWEWTQLLQLGEEKVEPTLLPAHPSPWVSHMLVSLCEELQRQGGFLLDRRRVVVPLVHRCLIRMLDAFEECLKAATHLFDEVAALQVYLDYGLLWKILRGGASSTEESIYRRYVSVRAKIQAHIDPINYTLFEPSLNRNVERAFAKCSALFEFLIQIVGTGAGGVVDADSPPVSAGPTATRDRGSSVSSSSIGSGSLGFLQEQHNLILQCPQPPRFALLPVSYTPPVPPASEYAPLMPPKDIRGGNNNKDAKAVLFRTKQEPSNGGGKPTSAAAATGTGESRPASAMMGRATDGLRTLMNASAAVGGTGNVPAASLSLLSTSIQSRLGNLFKD